MSTPSDDLVPSNGCLTQRQRATFTRWKSKFESFSADQALEQLLRRLDASRNGDGPICPAGACASVPICSYRYYDLVMAAFVTVLLCSNLIGAARSPSREGSPSGPASSSPSATSSGTSSPRCTGTRGRARSSGRASARCVRLGDELGGGGLPPAPGWPDQGPTRRSSAGRGESCSPRCWPTSAASSPTPTCSRR